MSASHRADGAKVGGFTQRCVISITDRLVIRTGRTIRVRLVVASGHHFSPQRRMDGI
jgi:hypothetical protein